MLYHLTPNVSRRGRTGLLLTPYASRLTRKRLTPYVNIWWNTSSGSPLA